MAAVGAGREGSTGESVSEKEDQIAGPDGPAEEGRAGEGIEAAARMGAEMAGQAHPDDGGPAGRERPYLEVVGPRADAFLPRFRRFEASGGAWELTWNWPCLFFGPLWFLYRKMYAWAAALLFTEMVVMPAVASSPGLSILVSVAYKIAVPAAGHWLYYRHVGKIVASSREAAATDAERADWRRARGGVSWVGPVVVTVVGFLGVLWAVSGFTPAP